MARDLFWSGKGDRRWVQTASGEIVGSVERQPTPEGPRWFALAQPSRGVVCGPCGAFSEAALGLVRAEEHGEL